MQPKRIDGDLPARIAGVIDRVVVQQHLHLALQALQGACGGADGHPGFDVLANHAVDAGAIQAGQHIALYMPFQGAVPSDLQPVFLQKRLHGL